MYTIPLTLRNEVDQLLRSSTTESEDTKDSGEVSDFSSLLTGFLKPDSANNVNEEELFAGLVMQRVYDLKGKEAGDAYKSVFEKQVAANTGKGGYIFYEKAARDALKEYTLSGALTAEEGDKIHSEAFNAAQLDDNKTALFDSYGGPNDPTRAVGSIATAIASAKALLDKIASGAEKLTAMPLNADYPAIGGSPLTKTDISSLDLRTIKGKKGALDGKNDGFLWKPESYTQHKAIIMLDPAFAGSVKSIEIKNSAGKTIDRGHYFSGGNEMYPREKWVFGKKGERYPENITLHMTLNNGKTKDIVIAKPGQRYD